MCCAASGEEALGLVDGGAAFDVVVADQRMPGMSGVDLLKEIRRRAPETVRLVLSGYADVQVLLEAVNEGAVYKFLTKPWDDGVLLDAVREAVDGALLRKENRRLEALVRRQRDELEAFNRCLGDGARDDLRVRACLDRLPVGLLAVDEDGCPLFFNREASRLLGLEESGCAALGDRLDAVARRPGVRRRASERVTLLDWRGTAYALWEE